MTDILELIMVICFGLSWPISIYKSYKAQSTKGKSVYFLYFILLGYGCGIVAKIVGENITYVIYFYILNFLMVATDIALFHRNRRLDQKRIADGTV